MTTTIPGADEPRPHDHVLLTLAVAEYLHEVGAVQDPNAVADPHGELPAIILGNLPPEPDRHVGIIGPWNTSTDSLTVPQLRFFIVQRTDPWAVAQLASDGEQIYRALERPDHAFNLTAQQRVAYCRRVVSDPPTQDANRRWTRISTYEVRALPPA